MGRGAWRSTVYGSHTHRDTHTLTHTHTYHTVHRDIYTDPNPNRVDSGIEA